MSQLALERSVMRLICVAYPDSDDGADKLTALLDRLEVWVDESEQAAGIVVIYCSLMAVTIRARRWAAARALLCALLAEPEPDCATALRNVSSVPVPVSPPDLLAPTWPHAPPAFAPVCRERQAA